MMLRKQIKQMLPWAWLFFCFMVLMLFLHRNLNDLLDADMAADLVLANLVVTSGNPVPSEWYYSTEIYLFGMQWFYAPFFLITQNWHLIRLGGMAASLICMLLSLYYLCRQLDLNKWFPLIGSLLLIPFSAQYQDMVIFSGFYTQYLIISFLVIGMMLHHFQTESRRIRFFLLILLALSSLLAGGTGLRMLLFLYIPAFVSALLFYGRSHASTRTSEKRLLLASSLCLLCSCIGCFLNITVLPLFYSYRQFGDVYLSNFSLEPFVNVVNDLLGFLGFQSGERLFSISLVNVFSCCLQLLLLLFSIYACLRKTGRTEIPVKKQFPVLIFVIGIILYTGVLSISNTPYSTYYIVPAAILTPVVIFVFISEWRESPLCRMLLTGALVILVTITGLRNYMASDQIQINNEIQNITASLVEDDYQSGYATFWNGNIITEFSNGQIDMRVWAPDETMDVTSLYRWLQAKEHENTTPEGKTFLLFSKWYNEQDSRWLGRWLQEEDRYWESQNYIVFGYESYHDLLNSVQQQYRASFIDGQWTYGTDQTPRGILPAQASTVLPSTPLYPGRYTVTLTGNAISSLSIECTHSAGSLVPTLQSVEDGQLVFTLETSELLHALRIKLTNTGSVPAEPACFELRKTEQ